MSEENTTQEEKMSPEEVAKETGGEVTEKSNLENLSEKIEKKDAEGEDEWEGGEEIPSAWFKFSEVGDMIKGTLTSKTFKAASGVFQDQWVYDLKTETGAIVKVGMSKEYIINKMKYVAEGQIVAFKFTEEIPSKKFPGKFAKSIDVRIFGLDEDYNSSPAEDDTKIDDVEFDA